MLKFVFTKINIDFLTKKNIMGRELNKLSRRGYHPYGLKVLAFSILKLISFAINEAWRDVES